MLINKRKFVKFTKQCIYTFFSVSYFFNKTIGFSFLRIVRKADPSNHFINTLFLLTYSDKFPVSFIYSENNCNQLLIDAERSILNKELFENIKFDDVGKNIKIMDFFRSVSVHATLTGRRIARNIYSSDVNLFKVILNDVRDCLKIEFRIMELRSISLNADREFHLSDEVEMTFPMPKKTTSLDAALDIRKVKIQKQIVWEVHSATIVDAFKVVKGNRILEYDKSARLDIEQVAGQWKNYLVLESVSIDSGIVLYASRMGKVIVNVEKGILLSGRASSNYFHWLIEYLPRLKNIDSSIFESHVVIVSKGMPQSFHESLMLVVPNAKVLEVDVVREEIVVDSLLIPSFHTNHPEDFVEEYWIGAGYSKEHLNFVRERVFSNLKENAEQAGSKRIYLKRNTGRSILNSNEVENYLMENGFLVVSPETLSFIQQVQLFKNADVIVGPGGAAFSNLIFCKPGTKIVICLGARNQDYVMQANLGNFSGCEVVHAIGSSELDREQYVSEEQYVHASYKIDLSTLESAFRCVNIKV